MRTIPDTPLFQATPIFKGFLGGLLIIGGIVNPFGFLIQAILFIVGVFLFIDAIVKEGEVSIVASFLSAVGGGVLSVIATVMEWGWLLMSVGIIVTGVYYFLFFSRQTTK